MIGNIFEYYYVEKYWFFRYIYCVKLINNFNINLICENVLFWILIYEWKGGEGRKKNNECSR